MKTQIPNDQSTSGDCESSNLDSLLAEAEQLVRRCLHHDTFVSPMMLAFEANEDPRGYPLRFFREDDLGDEKFAADARLVCIAYSAIGMVIIAKDYLKLVPGDGPLVSIPDSTADRHEVVCLVGEASGLEKRRFLRLIRDDQGCFLNLKECIPADPANCLKFIKEILPQHKPTPEEKSEAERLVSDFRLGR